jgi:hypothetical protein
MIKDTMKRKKPSFNESYHGYRSFSELLEDAQKEGLLELETDKRSRTYVVTRFGAEMTAKPEGDVPARKRSRRRRPTGKKRAADTNGGNGGGPAADETPAAAAVSAAASSDSTPEAPTPPPPVEEEHLGW